MIFFRLWDIVDYFLEFKKDHIDLNYEFGSFKLTPITYIFVSSQKKLKEKIFELMIKTKKKEQFYQAFYGSSGCNFLSNLTIYFNFLFNNKR